MKKHIHYIFFLAIILISVSNVYAQKDLKSIKIALKEHKSNAAISLIKSIKKNPDDIKSAKLFTYAVQAYLQQNEALNEKIYLHQKYDTIAFFNSIYEIYKNAMLCDSVEIATKKSKFLKSNSNLIERLYNNLSAGSRFFFLKKDYQPALKLLKSSIDVLNTRLVNKKFLQANKPLINENIAMLIKTAYYQHDYQCVLNYEHFIVEEPNSFKKVLLENIAESHAVLNDTINYLKYIHEGLQEDPSNMYFFTKLSDYYLQKKEYNKALDLSNSMLKKDSTNTLILAGKCLSLVNLQQYKNAIPVAKEIIKINPALTEPYYYAGLCYCKLAGTIILPMNINTKAYRTSIEQKQFFYKQALPYLEIYKKKVPQDTSKWAPLLYDIYLSLNMGKKFEEIETILSKL